MKTSIFGCAPKILKIWLPESIPIYPVVFPLLIFLQENFCFKTLNGGVFIIYCDLKFLDSD